MEKREETPLKFFFYGQLQLHYWVGFSPWDRATVVKPTLTCFSRQALKLTDAIFFMTQTGMLQISMS